MIRTQCTHCHAGMDAPDAYIGRSAKCVKCGKKFLIQEQAAVAASHSTAAHGSDRRSDSYALQAPPAAEPAAVSRPVVDAPAPFGTAGNGAAAQSSEHRYPNLLKYLAWGRSLSRIVLALTMVAAAFLFVVGQLATFVNAERVGFWETVFSFLAISLVTGMMLVAAYIAYVFMMASIEFVRVVVDIEANTRNRE